MSNLPNPPAAGDSASTNPTQVTNVAQPATPSIHKEQEPLGSLDEGTVEEVLSDVEITPELEQSGVVGHKETIDLPPDVKGMGVEAVGPAQPVMTTGTTNLPLTDNQIAQGLKARILSSIRWLAEWCVRQLKKAHVHLTNKSGHAVRELG